MTLRIYRKLAFFVLLILGLPVYAQTPPLLPPNQLSFDAAEGKQIKNIQIVVLPIFDDANPAWLYRQANNVKTATHQSTIREELNLTEGNTFRVFAAQEMLRRLRALKYIRNAQVKVFPDGNGVKLLVIVQDTWTLIPQVNWSSGSGKSAQSIGLAEGNLFGRGERFEVSLQDENSRQTFETVYDDPHFIGTENRLVAAYFDRSDGDEVFGYFGKPVRTLLDEDTWFVTGMSSDFVGRLYDAGDESYIYRKQIDNFDAQYSVAFGDPEVKRTRLFFGFNADESQYLQATAQDYKDLNLDPGTVSNDASLVPKNRKFYGPTVGFSSIEPEYVSMNYIDRFDRVEDYNLGVQEGVSLTYASEFLGSKDDTVLFSMNKGDGIAFSRESFAKGELGFGGRASGDGLSNTLARAEAKYFNVLGDLSIDGYWLGRHTLASSALFEYGHNFDGDRQFLLGADNGLRGYDAQALTGDKLSVIDVEDRMHFIDDWQELISVGAAVFAEAGGATYSKFQDTVGDDLYADVGVGLRLAFPRSSGDRVLRIDLAFPLRDGPDGSSAWQLRLIFAGGNTFNSQLQSETLGTEQANVSVGVEKP